MQKSTLCRLPSTTTVTGRSSSITNAFINSVVPAIVPSDAEVLEALAVLGMDESTIRCVYCGDRHTEWDHFRPIVTGQKPTGYITEIANLVPSCGKCNQSKGKSDWQAWMRSSARLSPTTRGVKDIEERVARLVAFSSWRKPVMVDFAAVAGEELWEKHLANWREVLGLLKSSQILALQIRQRVGLAP